MPVVETEAPPLADPTTLSHDSHKNGVIACAIVCLATAAAFTGLRFYTRIRIVRVLGATDWWLLASLVWSCLQSIFFIKQAIYGLGSHVWDIDVAANYLPLQKTAWFTILFYNIALSFIKTSFLLLYFNIFTYSRARLACQIILALVVISFIWTVTITATACIPLKAFWDVSIQGAYCHKTELWWVNTGLHVVTDFMIFLVPLPQIWRMKLPKGQKIILVILFSLGFLVAFISIVRVIFLVDLHKKKDPDFTWAGARLSYLSLVELNAAIIVACLITLKPLANKLWPSMFSKPESGDHISGENPPTIGTWSPLRDGAGNDITGKVDLEAWEMSKMDPESERSVSVTEPTIQGN